MEFLIKELESQKHRQQISTATSVDNKERRPCEKHDLVKLYFCMDQGCQVELCPDCFIEGHAGHKKRLASPTTTSQKSQGSQDKTNEILTKAAASVKKKVTELCKMKEEQYEMVKLSKQLHEFATKKHDAIDDQIKERTNFLDSLKQTSTTGIDDDV